MRRTGVRSEASRALISVSVWRGRERDRFTTRSPPPPFLAVRKAAEIPGPAAVLVWHDFPPKTATTAIIGNLRPKHDRETRTASAAGRFTSRQNATLAESLPHT